MDLTLSFYTLVLNFSAKCRIMGSFYTSASHSMLNSPENIIGSVRMRKTQPKPMRRRRSLVLVTYTMVGRVAYLRQSFGMVVRRAYYFMDVVNLLLIMYLSA